MKIIGIVKVSQKGMILIKNHLEAKLIRIFHQIVTIIVNERFYILIAMMKCFSKAKSQTLILPMKEKDCIKITLELY